MSSRAERKARNHAAILDAARAQFLAEGYAGTTIRTIATKAGVSPGSVIVHFRDKRALLIACFHDDLSRAQRELWSTLDQGAPLLDQLVHCGRVLYRSYAERRPLSREMFRETLFPEHGDPPDTLAEPFLTRVAQLHRDALERGELRRLPGGGEVEARSFFSAYLAVLVGGLGGYFGETEDPETAAQMWAAALRDLLEVQHTGLR